MNTSEIQTLSSIKQIFERQRAFFESGKTRAAAHRKGALKKLRTLVKANENMLDEAIYADLRKGSFDNYATELAFIYEESSYCIKNIEKWMEPTVVPTNLTNVPGKSWIQPEPYGTSLIIGAWNYPYQLSLGPIVPSVAAGNTVILKPSELAKNTSAVMAEIINNNFEEIKVNNLLKKWTRGALPNPLS